METPPIRLTDLQRLVGAIAPRKLILSGFIDGEYLIRWPTVGEALTCYTLITRYETDPDARSVLRDLFRGWLPGPVASALIARTMNQVQRMAFVLYLCDTSGIEEDARTSEVKDEMVEWVRNRNWPSTIAEYRSTYHVGSVLDVLGESWPLFLDQVSRMPEVQAYQQVQSMSWYAAVRTGEYKPLMQNAGFTHYGKYEIAPHMTPEWQQKQVEEAVRIAAMIRNRRNPNAEA